MGKIAVKKWMVLLYLLLGSQGVWGQDSLITVSAQKGDGIFSILRRNGLDPSTYYDDFLDLNADRIVAGNALLVDQDYYLPYTDSLPDKKENAQLIKEYPIFGEALSKVDSISGRMQNTVYYLVSGHGGPDPGAVAHYNGKLIAEDEYAYDITLRLGRQLIANGAKVFFIVKDVNDGIRDTYGLDVDHDEVAYPNNAIPLGQLARLRQRTEAINKLYLDNLGQYQRLLVIHIDSRSKGENIDVFFYHHEHSKKGEDLAKNIHRVFVEKYREFQPNRTYNGTFSERSELYLVRNTLPAMTYIEIGNIKSQRDRKRILDPDNRQALAKWIFEGIALDYESQDP